MPKDARKKAEAEFKKLKLMSPMSAEATVVRNYIEALVSLPWRKKSKINTDLVAAEKVLDEETGRLTERALATFSPADREALVTALKRIRNNLAAR